MVYRYHQFHPRAAKRALLTPSSVIDPSVKYTMLESNQRRHFKRVELIPSANGAWHSV